MAGAIMDIQLECSSCKKALAVRSRYQGLRLPCPNCGATLEVPKTNPLPAVAPTALSAQPVGIVPAAAAMPAAAPPANNGGGFETEALPVSREHVTAPNGDMGAPTVGASSEKNFRSVEFATSALPPPAADRPPRWLIVRTQRRQRQKWFYIAGSLVMAGCLALNFFVTFPVLFGDPLGLVRKGDELLAAGAVDDAIANYRKAARLAGHFEPAHLRLGAALKQIKQYDEARRELELVAQSEFPTLQSEALLELADMELILYADTRDSNHLQRGAALAQQARLANPTGHSANELISRLRYETMVTPDIRAAFQQVYATECENLRHLNETAPARARFVEIITSQSNRPVTGYCWKYLRFENPERHIRILPDNSLVGAIDVELQAFSTPLRASQDEAHADQTADFSKFSKGDISQITTLEFQWQNSVWTRTRDPIRDMIADTAMTQPTPPAHTHDTRPVVEDP